MNEKNRAIVKLCRLVFERVDPVIGAPRIISEVADDVAESDVERIAQHLIDTTPERFHHDATREAAAQAGGNLYDRIRRETEARRVVEERRGGSGADRLGVIR